MSSRRLGAPCAKVAGAWHRVEMLHGTVYSGQMVYMWPEFQAEGDGVVGAMHLSYVSNTWTLSPSNNAYMAAPHMHYIWVVNGPATYRLQVDLVPSAPPPTGALSPAPWPSPSP
jgi:hypothetical protein